MVLGLARDPVGRLSSWGWPVSTGIQWTDETWNPVRGCSRVSDGCTNCYAMGQAHRFSGPGKPYEGLTTIRRGKVDWAGKARLVPEMLAAPLKWKKPRRIFVNSMSDLFHDSLSFEEIAAVFGVMAACPQHTFQVLTKRPKRALEFFAWCEAFNGGHPIHALEDALCTSEADFPESWDGDTPILCGCWAEWPLPNVWLGVSAENQEQADKRIPLLLQCPAAVRFVSAEPLLGPVDVSRFMWPVSRFIDWVIVGGESGPGARPCNVEWIRSIVMQCGDAGVPVFVKQLGAKPRSFSREMRGEPGVEYPLAHKKGADPSEWPDDLRVRQFPEVSQ